MVNVKFNIERLPPEIIEIIFLHALEVNFARASHRVATTVSREAIYKVFLLEAFWNDPQDCFRVANVHRESIYLDNNHSQNKTCYPEYSSFRSQFIASRYKPLSINEQRRLQAHVVRCRWFTLHRLEAVLPTMLYMSFQVTVRLQCSPQTSTEVIKILQYLSEYGTLGCLHSTHPRQCLKILDACTISASYCNPRAGCNYFIRTVRVHVIPDWLLQGPWSADKVKLLSLLRRAFGARFRRNDLRDWAEIQRSLAPSFSRLKCLQGMVNAIQESNKEALMYLLDIHQTFGQRKPGGNKTSGLPPKLPSVLYHAAINYCPQDPAFLGLLIYSSPASLPDDSIINEWAFTARQNGIELGKWILDFNKFRKQAQWTKYSAAWVCHLWKNISAVLRGQTYLRDRELIVNELLAHLPVQNVLHIT